MRIWTRVLGATLGLTVVREAWADPPSYLDQAYVAEASQRALEHAGLDDRHGSMAVRARAAAWLPTVGVSVSRVQGGSLTETTSNFTSRLLANDAFSFSVHMSLALDRLVFDPREAAIERVEIIRRERAEAMEALVVELLGRMEQARINRVEAARGAALNADVQLTGAIARARMELLIGAALDVLDRSRR